MARDGQVLPPVPTAGTNTLCMVVLLSIAGFGQPGVFYLQA